MIRSMSALSNVYFNTSNVTIQQLFHLQYYPEYRHFNTSNVTIQPLFVRVTPVLKGISIHLMLLFNYKPNLRLQSLVNFNTSNVTIQHAKYRCCKDLKYYFNTSNVTIQRIEPVFLDLP